MKSKLLNNLIYLIFVTAITFSLLEISIRIYFGEEIFTLKDYRVSITEMDENGFPMYDENLGWKQRPNMGNGGMITIDYGIRRSGPHQKVVKGAVLVSGSSFTGGSGVVDEEMWTSIVERNSDNVVLNAAVGGYGLDQIILRAKSLIDKLEPKFVIIDIQDVTIQWSSYSFLTYPKPYFTINNNKLIRHHYPVPTMKTSGFANKDDDWLFVKYLKYSYMSHRIFSKYFPEIWFYKKWQKVVNRKDIDPVKLSCLLVRDFKEFLEERDLKFAIVSIPSGQEYELRKKGKYLSQVEKCIRNYGINYIDYYDELFQEIEKGTITAFDFWDAHGNPSRAVGHPGKRGHEYIANQVLKNLNF